MSSSQICLQTERGSGIMKNKKLPAILLAAMFAGNMFLCSCTAVKTTETTVTESSSEETTTTVTETTEETTAETTATTKHTSINGRQHSPYEEFTLDGVKDHHFISTDFCYLVSEKYVLFLEKDIDIPGDYAANLDAIIDELEVLLGMSACPDGYNYPEVADMTSYFGFNPWDGWHIGNKLPIFLCVDRTDEALISCACSDFVVFVQYELFTEELWNSVPSFRDNSWRKSEYVNYSETAHEITHAITGRNCQLSEIMTEGIADYMGRVVIDELADSCPSIAEVKANRLLYDYTVPEAVNAENAERIFVEDYNQIGAADRGAEYVYGRYLCEYLNGEFGDGFFSMYTDKVIEKHIDYAYGNYSEEIALQYTETLKEVFGEDIFTKFGDWCVENNALQE